MPTTTTTQVPNTTESTNPVSNGNSTLIKRLISDSKISFTNFYHLWNGLCLDTTALSIDKSTTSGAGINNEGSTTGTIANKENWESMLRRFVRNVGDLGKSNTWWTIVIP